MTKTRVLLSWSSGKDSAWCLHTLNSDPDVEVVGLLTSFNEEADRVAMHAVRRELTEAQALSAGLPLFPVFLPWPCSNEQYESAMKDALSSVHTRTGFDAVAFGDLFLQDIRDYRESQMEKWGFEPAFPIWGENTGPLAGQMIASGIEAFLTCVDPKQCPPEFAGRRFDNSLLEELPDSIDPCGENGEFHTFVTNGPMFADEIPITGGETVERDGFVFADLLPAGC